MNKQIKKTKDKAHLEYRKDLFEQYLKTAKQLKRQMEPLFNTGIDTERKICSLSIKEKENFSYFFPQQMIDDFREFLDKILQFKKFPNRCKPFEEFLFKDGTRYSLCACYKKFSALNELEISYAEDVAQYDM